ncbi:MAG: hypothetical protein WBP81_06310 [Solirubrobacteraceae bacterium]
MPQKAGAPVLEGLDASPGRHYGLPDTGALANSTAWLVAHYRDRPAAPRDKRVEKKDRRDDLPTQP